MDDIEADPLSVHCPTCGVVAGDSCPNNRPCRTRCILARVEARRAVEKQQRMQSTQTGLAKVRAALETAYGARR